MKTAPGVWWKGRRAVAVATVVAVVIGCRHPGERERGHPVAVALSRAPSPEPTASRMEINPRLLRRFAPIAGVADNHVAVTPERVSLGRMLWYDRRLSRNRDQSCNSCHALDAYGVDGLATSTGFEGTHGRRNAPTVYNAAEHFALFWDGRARNVEEQASRPIVNPEELAMTDGEVVTRLHNVPVYVALFRQAFPDDREAVTLDNVGKAIGAFERGLVTHSRWDDYLAGRHEALSATEIQGLRLFLNVGCVGCHTGPQVGASMFQLVGAVEPWPRQDDLGRFEITHAPTDRMVFKVPTLRNIAQTAPYFHDGSCALLPDAVRLMGRHQLGLELTDPEVNSLVAFLAALTGELPQHYIARPALPPDSPRNEDLSRLALHVP